jgi:hypothetical protein
MKPKYPLLWLGLLGTHLDSIQQKKTNRTQFSLWREKMVTREKEEKIKNFWLKGKDDRMIKAVSRLE